MAHSLKDVGGTRGGLGLFVLGLVMAVAGAYLISTQVTVFGGYWTFFGYGAGTSFGMTLVPLLFGVGFLFYDAKSMVGWVLTVLGAVVIFAGIIVNLNIHFRSTSLYNTLIMLVLLVGGLGLILRSLRPVGGAKEPAADG